MTCATLEIRLLAMALLIADHGHTKELPGATSEYQVKAAFIYNFVKFVEWPPEPGEPGDPISICVFGKDPFGSALERVVGGRNANGRPIEIRRPSGIAAAQSCQVLFVSSSESARLEAIFKSISSLSVLTVSEIGRFCERGGVIEFVVEEQRIRFRINVKAAALANLKISSKLLQLALTTPDDKESH
jgi:hypothetical protein